MVDINKFSDYMETQQPVTVGSEILPMFDELAQRALKITFEINSRYHTPDELRKLFSELTGKQVDESFRFFPPFYTDCGRNITVGKNVFINMCCRFQDQGGITIDDNCFIGHNVTFATLNHDINPKHRIDMHPAPIIVNKNVWIGSDSTILPGVTIGEGSIIGAGSVVTKDVPSYCIAAGNPCKVIKYIDKNI